MNNKYSKNSLAFIGESDGVRALRKIIPAVAISSSTVLITGESGTGKEIVARSLHIQSNRSDGNFVPINCAAIPKELLESELFGHKKGAFTGAITDKIGRFELAHGGSIFLDEIGDMSMDIQVKLLRVLQEKTIDPLGSVRTIPIDVRVIAATHRDLENEIKEGRFREDLYYRLNVIPLNTQPLRERASDVPMLLSHFSKIHVAPDQDPITFSPDFVRALQEYAWPGNVRELSNLIDRFSTLFAGQCLELGSLPASLLPRGLAAIQSARLAAGGSGEVRAPSPLAAVIDEADSGVSEVEKITMLSQALPILPPEGLSLKHRLAEIERDLISQALSRTNGNISQTARILNLQRTTLIEKIQKFGLRPS
ncbi:MAG: sigma-54 dependent transcriptional regulator [Burkholderiales bacterium]